MEKGIDPEIIKSTQILLGKYVKRPPLTEKLLKKPPFRFLHDIITTVLKSTGFFSGLFNDDELVSENVKDRDSKILFLNKVIIVLGDATGTAITAKPSKIVAGQEPEKTNELLQCLANALDNNVSSNEAVKKFKDTSLKVTQQNDVKIVETIKVPKKTDAKSLSSKSTEKLTSRTQDLKKKLDQPISKNDKAKVNTKSQPKENINAKKLTPAIRKSQSQEKKYVKSQEHGTIDHTIVTSTNEDRLTDHVTEEEVNGHEIIEIKKVNEKKEVDNEKEINTSNTIINNDSNLLTSPPDIVENKINTTTSLIKDNVVDVIDEPNEKVYVKSLNDSSQDKSNVVENQSGNKTEQSGNKDKEIEEHKYNKDEKLTNNVRPSSSRPGAPRQREKYDNSKASENILLGRVNIIEESVHNEDEEDTSTVLEEVALNTETSFGDHSVELTSDQHGHLVNQILDSQKELKQQSNKTEIEWQLGANKAREAENQEIEQLRFSIQALSRVANPLGKLLDHVQEDVEVMRQELSQWTETYNESSKDLQKEKMANEQSLIPLHTRLKKLDIDIKDKHEKINNLKIVIHKNTTRIDKLLKSGNVQLT